MATDYLPTGDSELLGFATNYSGIITADPTSVGLTAPIAVILAGYVSTYETKLDALETPANRSPIAIQEKDEAKETLVDYIRLTARQIQGTMTVTNLQRAELRLTIRDTEPTPAEVITDAPALTVKEVFGRNIRIQVRDVTGEVRGRPANALGCLIYSFVGATPPDGYQGWTSEGALTKDSVIVAFPETATPGTKVWFTAAWFNTKGAGPGCTPVASMIGVEGALAA